MSNLEPRAFVSIYTDGACSGNPGPGGWGALIFDKAAGTVTELGGSERDTTNNRMELSAVVHALQSLSDSRDVRVHSDSSYVIQAAAAWLERWKRTGWKTFEGDEVKNRDLWEKLDREISRMSLTEWVKVPGHSGVPENERVDQIAVAYSHGQPISLYQGPEAGYALQPSQDTASFSALGGSPNSYYLSLVSGVLSRDSTWADCESRVKGKSGARYKKVKSRHEEEQVLKDWKYAPKNDS